MCCLLRLSISIYSLRKKGRSSARSKRGAFAAVTVYCVWKRQGGGGGGWQLYLFPKTVQGVRLPVVTSPVLGTTYLQQDASTLLCARLQQQ